VRFRVVSSDARPLSVGRLLASFAADLEPVLREDQRTLVCVRKRAERAVRPVEIEDLLLVGAAVLLVEVQIPTRAGRLLTVRLVTERDPEAGVVRVHPVCRHRVLLALALDSELPPAKDRPFAILGRLDDESVGVLEPFLLDFEAIRRVWWIVPEPIEPVPLDLRDRRVRILREEFVFGGPVATERILPVRNGPRRTASGKPIQIRYP
jgi:hypothetical protein